MERKVRDHNHPLQNHPEDGVELIDRKFMSLLKESGYPLLYITLTVTCDEREIGKKY